MVKVTEVKARLGVGCHPEILGHTGLCLLLGQATDGFF